MLFFKKIISLKIDICLSLIEKRRVKQSKIRIFITHPNNVTVCIIMRLYRNKVAMLNNVFQYLTIFSKTC